MNQNGRDIVYLLEEEMTPQERQLLESLSARIANTPPPQKDAEADQLIQERIGSRPDALYILAQTVLIQEMALNQANGRLHDLQQAQQNPPQHTSFLGRLFGGDPQPQYSQSQYAPQQPQYAQQQQQYAQPPQYAQPQYQQAAPSFLRSAATTATGVAAGALAFEGIESLIHGFGGGGGYGGNNFGGGFGGGGGNETINNYYNEPRGENRGDNQSASFLDDSSSDVSNADYSDDSSSSDSSFDDSSSGGDNSV